MTLTVLSSCAVERLWYSCVRIFYVACLHVPRTLRCSVHLLGAFHAAERTGY